MYPTNEINALFSLIDDPDMEVFETVSDRIAGFGKAIIPNLETLLETTVNHDMQERIEKLIMRVHHNELSIELQQWAQSEQPELFKGAFLVAKYLHPDLQSVPLEQEIEKIRRNIWIELNPHLTPFEEANILTSIIYNYYNLSGSEVDYRKPDDFLINKVLQNKKGNTIGNGILYKILCDLLEINTAIVQIPKHLIIAYYRSNLQPGSYCNAQEKIYFFIDGTTGHPFSHNDIEAYLKRMNIEPQLSFYEPMSNLQIIALLIAELAKCFHHKMHRYKADALQQLLAIVEAEMNK